MKRSVLLILTIVTILTASSCISSSVESEEKRVSIFFSVANIGEDIQIDEDVINIEEFKFSLDRFNLYAENDVVLQSSGDVGAFLFAYTDEITSQRLILDVGLGFSDVEIFTGYEIFFEPVENGANILDADFFGSGDNYSQVIRGTVNEVDFEFKASFTFEKFYDINEVQLTDREETLVISKFIDLEDVFVDTSGNFLDPTVQENEVLIMQNIEQNLIANFGSESVF